MVSPPGFRRAVTARAPALREIPPPTRASHEIPAAAVQRLPHGCVRQRVVSTASFAKRRQAYRARSVSRELTETSSELLVESAHQILGLSGVSGKLSVEKLFQLLMGMNLFKLSFSEMEWLVRYEMNVKPSAAIDFKKLTAILTRLVALEAVDGPDEQDYLSQRLGEHLSYLTAHPASPRARATGAGHDSLHPDVIAAMPMDSCFSKDAAAALKLSSMSKLGDRQSAAMCVDAAEGGRGAAFVLDTTRPGSPSDVLDAIPGSLDASRRSSLAGNSLGLNLDDLGDDQDLGEAKEGKGGRKGGRTSSYMERMHALAVQIAELSPRPPPLPTRPPPPAENGEGEAGSGKRRPSGRGRPGRARTPEPVPEGDDGEEGDRAPPLRPAQPVSPLGAAAGSLAGSAAAQADPEEAANFSRAMEGCALLLRGLG